MPWWVEYDPPLLPGVSGALERIPFPLVLHHLHGMRASGVLHLTCGKKRKWIQLREGYPLAVRSNMIQETLGHFLVRNGRITNASLADRVGLSQSPCLQRMKRLEKAGKLETRKVLSGASEDGGGADSGPPLSLELTPTVAAPEAMTPISWGSNR